MLRFNHIKTRFHHTQSLHSYGNGYRNRFNNTHYCLDRFNNINFINNDNHIFRFTKRGIAINVLSSLLTSLSSTFSVFSHWSQGQEYQYEYNIKKYLEHQHKPLRPKYGPLFHFPRWKHRFQARVVSDCYHLFYGPSGVGKSVSLSNALAGFRGVIWVSLRSNPRKVFDTFARSMNYHGSRIDAKDVSPSMLWNVFEGAIRRFSEKHEGMKPIVVVEDIEQCVSLDHPEGLLPDARDFVSGLLDFYNIGLINVVYNATNFKALSLLQKVSGHSSRLTMSSFPDLDDNLLFEQLLDLYVDTSGQHFCFQKPCPNSQHNSKDMHPIRNDPPDIDGFHNVMQLCSGEYDDDEDDDNEKGDATNKNNYNKKRNNVYNIGGDRVYCGPQTFEYTKVFPNPDDAQLVVASVGAHMADIARCLRSVLSGERSSFEEAIECIIEDETESMYMQWASSANLDEMACDTHQYRYFWYRLFEALEENHSVRWSRLPGLTIDMLPQVHKLVDDNLISFTWNMRYITLHSRKQRKAFQRLKQLPEIERSIQVAISKCENNKNNCSFRKKKQIENINK